MSFNTRSETDAQIIFTGGLAPFPALYQIPIGTIGGEKLAGMFAVTYLAVAATLVYSFWIGEANNG